MEKVTNEEIYDLKMQMQEQSEDCMSSLFDILVRLVLENRELLKQLVNKKCGCDKPVDAISNIVTDPLQLNKNDILIGKKE